MSLALAVFWLLVMAFHLPLLRTSRQLILTVANYIFAALLIPGGQNWAVVGCFLATTYWFLLLMQARRSYNLLLILVVATLVLFLVIKGYFQSELEYVVTLANSLEFLRPHSVHWQSEFVEAVGLSYMLCKFIDALVQQREGTLEPCDFLTYINYQLAFFTLLAGPIQRYNDFYRYWSNLDLAPLGNKDVLQAWSRVLVGILKFGAIAPLVERSFLIKNTEAGTDWLGFTSHFYLYPIYLYLNFSGYSDMAIGAGRLLGFILPENFDRPFAARNLLEFWNRWHMSLTHWVRDLVFMPAYKRAAESYPRWAKPLGCLLLIVSMCVVGLWHGITTSYILFGLINGIGVAANQVYADSLRARLGREGLRHYKENSGIHAAARVMTFHFVCFAFLFFAFEWGVAGKLVEEFGLGIVGFMMLGMALAWLTPLARILGGGAKPWLYWQLSEGWVSLGGIVFVEVFLVTMVFFALWAFNQPGPEVIYQRF